MSDHIKKTINDIEAKLKPIEVEAKKLKTTINQLCQVAGLPERYRIDADEPETSIPTEIGSDQFYGQPLATCVRTYLEMREAAGNERTSTVAEIYDALVQGGYRFESKNGDYAKRGLRQSLTKNTAFHKLPNGRYGLTAWYPNAKPARAAEPDNSTAAEPGTAGDADDDDNQALKELLK